MYHVAVRRAVVSLLALGDDLFLGVHALDAPEHVLNRELVVLHQAFHRRHLQSLVVEEIRNLERSMVSPPGVGCTPMVPWGRADLHTHTTASDGWPTAELDFDGVEVENATPGFYVFNQLARRLNMGLGAAELGCSDAHIVDAVGRAFTEFPGATPEQLRQAIESGDTRAGRRRY